MSEWGQFLGERLQDLLGRMKRTSRAEALRQRKQFKQGLVGEPRIRPLHLGRALGVEFLRQAQYKKSLLGAKDSSLEQSWETGRASGMILVLGKGKQAIEVSR